MAQVVGTVAKVDKLGVWSHRHEGVASWHWASAGHGNAPFHKAAKASTPQFPDGTSAALKASYLAAVNRVAGYVSVSPGKAFPKGLYVQASKAAPAAKVAKAAPAPLVQPVAATPQA